MRARRLVVLVCAFALLGARRLPPGRPPLDPQVERMVEALRRSGAVSVDVETDADRARCFVTTTAGRRHVLLLEASTKGNGVLRAGDASVHLLDQHDDGFVFDPPCLAVRLRAADGATELQVEGWAVETMDESKNETFRRTPVLGVFRLDEARGDLAVLNVEGPVALAR